jgi:hypothetical protein
MMKNLIRDIKRIDKKLLTKIQQGKITENFGQSDVRKLRDKYDYLTDKEIGSMIRDFDMYCATMNSSSKGFFNE